MVSTKLLFAEAYSVATVAPLLSSGKPFDVKCTDSAPMLQNCQDLHNFKSLACCEIQSNLSGSDRLDKFIFQWACVHIVVVCVCLQECTNDCCNANNCTLKEEAQCAHGVCCEGCKVRDTHNHTQTHDTGRGVFIRSLYHEVSHQRIDTLYSQGVSAPSHCNTHNCEPKAY